jgi:hypothetical protein
MAEWYYARNNQRLGPVSMDQLKQLASTGGLSPTDLVWKDGMPNWAAASTIAGLFPAPAAAARPAAVASPAAPAAVAPAPAVSAAPAAVAPAPGVSPDDFAVAPTAPRGPAGTSPVDLGILFAQRTFAGDMSMLPLADTEKDSLLRAGITGETTQRYLVWRRSLLWAAAVPLAFAGISLGLDSMLYTSKSLTTLGMLLEVLRVLTMLALPAAAVLAAMAWNKPELSTRLALLGLLVGFGLPLVILLLPASWYFDQLSLAVGGNNMHYSLAIAVLCIPPALVRGCLRVRTLLPESVMTGLLLVCVSLMSGLFFFGVLSGAATIASSILTTVFTLCIVLAPLCYVVGSSTVLRPIASASDRAALMKWQWIYYGLCGFAGLIVVISALSSSALTAWHYWSWLLLFLDFLGRSLFASVVAAQFILSLTRSTYITQQQVAKTDQGTTLDARLSELESIVGKM